MPAMVSAKKKRTTAIIVLLGLNLKLANIAMQNRIELAIAAVLFPLMATKNPPQNAPVHKIMKFNKIGGQFVTARDNRQWAS